MGHIYCVSTIFVLLSLLAAAQAATIAKASYLDSECKVGASIFPAKYTIDSCYQRGALSDKVCISWAQKKKKRSKI